MAQDELAETPQRWTARRRATLVLRLLKGETSAAEAARQPRRYQRSTVSGRTTARWRLQRRRSSRVSTQKTSSPRRSLGRYRVGRARTASCWRSGRPSAATSARGPTAARTNATTNSR
jgi:hypothetical protein